MRSKRKIAVFLIVLALLFVVIRLQRQPGGEHDTGLGPDVGPSAAAPDDPAPSDPSAPAVVDASVPRPEVGPADLSAIARRAADLPSTVNPYPTRHASDDAASLTRHQIQLGGKTISYHALTGLMPIKNASATVTARLFFTAYQREFPGNQRPENRPLTFAFNGGPGASSVWLHFALGPKRVVLTHEGRALEPPYELAHNDQSWLEFTDLVIVDALGTGYSRPAVHGNREFYGMQKDVELNAQFIRLYITRFEHWGTPLFVLGESYGSIRAVGMAGHLQEYFGIDLNGLILVSYPLDFRTMFFNSGDDFPYALFLPSYCATAMYHGRLSRELMRDPQRTLREVERWALNDYIVALAKGDTLQGEARRRIVETLASYTGLDAVYIERKNLRVSNADFIRDLLRDAGESVGWQDSRFRTPGRYEIPFSAPEMLESTGPYVATWNRYVRDELQFHDDRVYEFVSRSVNMGWDWGAQEVRLVNFFDPIRATMHRNRHLRILVIGGIYDLNTPYFGMHYSLNHVGLHPDLHRNIDFRAYRSGHQVYIDLEAMVQLRKDAKSFILGEERRSAADEDPSAEAVFVPVR